MKKYICLLLALILSISTTSFASSTADDDPLVQALTVEPRSSYVFESVGSSISPSAYGGDCALVDKGSGTMKITLQKYSSSSNSWVTKAGPYSKSFSDRGICAFSKSKILTPGKWRCKTYVKATVGSHTDSRTVYTGTLTITDN